MNISRYTIDLIESYVNGIFLFWLIYRLGVGRLP